MTSDGRKLQADGLVEVALPGDRSAGWTPARHRAAEPSAEAAAPDVRLPEGPAPRTANASPIPARRVPSGRPIGRKVEESPLPPGATTGVVPEGEGDSNSEFTSPYVAQSSERSSTSAVLRASHAC